MVQFLIAFIVMAIVCLIIARINKSGRMYTQLMLGVCLGFIVGAAVKHKVSAVNLDNETVIAHPTAPSQVSSAVWNDTPCTPEPSQEKHECDTITKPESKVSTCPQQTMYFDDS